MAVQGRTVLLYDGECPFCTSMSEYYKMKRALPTLEIISMRDADQLRALQLPADLDFNRGMVVLTPDGQLKQGEPAFQWINSKIKLESLKDFFMVGLNSYRALSFFVYPCLKLGRLIVLKFKKIDSHLKRVDL